MPPLSDFAEAALLNHLFRGAASPRQDTYYLDFYTSPTSDAGGGTLVSTADWTNYAAAALDASVADTIFAAAALEGVGHECETTEEIDFGVAVVPGDPVTITHVAIRTAAAPAGNHVLHGALAEPKIIQNGDPVKIPVGELAAGLR